MSGANREVAWLMQWSRGSASPLMGALWIDFALEGSWWLMALKRVTQRLSGDGAKKRRPGEGESLFTPIDFREIKVSAAARKSKKSAQVESEELPRSLVEQLAPLKERSLFGGDHLYGLLLPGRVSSRLKEELEEIARHCPHALIWINPPRDLSFLAQAFKKGEEGAQLLDLQAEKPWDRKSRWQSAALRFLESRCPTLKVLKSVSSFSSLWQSFTTRLMGELYSSCSSDRRRLQSELEKLVISIEELLERHHQQGSLPSLEELVNLQEELLFFPGEEVVWELFTQLLRGDVALLKRVDLWLEKDPSAIMTASVLRREIVKSHLWMELGTLPTNFAREGKKKEERLRLLSFVRERLPRALEVVNEGLFALKDGVEPQGQLERLLCELLDVFHGRSREPKELRRG